MRNVMWLLVVVACGGAASSEVRTARTAQYEAPLGQLFDAALEETQAEYTIGEVDPAHFRFATKPQFYSPLGERIGEGAEGTVQHVHDRAKLMHIVVEVRQVDKERAAVVVSPRTFEMIDGSPKPRELAPDDPNLPPWVQGRVDNLAVKIHQRLSPLMAKTGAAQAP